MARFNDLFAVIIWLSSVAIYVLQGMHLVDVPQIVLGMLISIDTTVVYHYFRKKPRSPEQTPQTT